MGTLGPVFRTYEPTRDRLVAVKVFRLDITPEQAQSLAAELRRAADAGLFHPSIVEPVAAGVQGTVAYRADEYVAAESLDVAMRHYAPASLDRVLPFITQLAGAIDFARAAGVGHGALHPRDVFVTPDEARATGFGVVDALERVGIRAPVRRPYSAPERIAGGAWGTPADVFSLAAVTFELLTGRRPSGVGDEIGSLSGAIVGGQLEPLRAVLARAMSEEAGDRYPTALAFAEALETAARAEATITEAAAPVPAAPVSSAAGVGKPPAFPLRPVEEPAVAAIESLAADDIEAERDEDEAHWALSRDEQRGFESVPEVEDATQLFGDEERTAAGEELVYQAADLTLAPVEPESPSADTLFADELRAPSDVGVRPESPLPVASSATRRAEEPGRRSASIVPRPPIAPPRPPKAIDVPAPRRQEPVEPFGSLFREHIGADVHQSSERPAHVMLPLAAAVLLGLLIGFAGGYAFAMWSAGPDIVAQSGESAPPTSPPAGPAPAATGGRSAQPYSEQAVSPPAAPPPAAPAVPGDAPASPGSKAPAERRPPPAPSSGTLMVRSTPSRAGVTVNGRWRGRTPLPLENLAFGDYVVRVVSPGHEVAREEFTLSATNASRTISVRLERQRRAAAPPPARGAAVPSGAKPSAPFTGSVFVDSRPRGARVFVDGKEVGTTPLRLAEVGIGSHVVRLELPDHRIWSNSVRVAAGAESRVTGSLEPIR